MIDRLTYLAELAKKELVKKLVLPQQTQEKPPQTVIAKQLFRPVERVLTAQERIERLLQEQMQAIPVAVPVEAAPLTKSIEDKKEQQLAALRADVADTYRRLHLLTVPLAAAINGLSASVHEHPKSVLHNQNHWFSDGYDLTFVLPDNTESEWLWFVSMQYGQFIKQASFVKAHENNATELKKKGFKLPFKWTDDQYLHGNRPHAIENMTEVVEAYSFDFDPRTQGRSIRAILATDMKSRYYDVRYNMQPIYGDPYHVYKSRIVGNNSYYWFQTEALDHWTDGFFRSDAKSAKGKTIEEEVGAVRARLPFTNQSPVIIPRATLIGIASGQARPSGKRT